MSIPTATKTKSSNKSEKLTVVQDRNIATFAHFGGVLGCIPSAIIYFLYRGRGPFCEQESKEALNFTLLPTLVILVSVACSFIPFIGGFFALVATLIWLYLAVMSLIAGIKVNRSNPYQYRFNTMLFSTLGRR